MKENWQLAEEFWRDFFPAADGQLQPGSGNQPGRPGDTRYKSRVVFEFNEKVLLESKSSKDEKRSISIKEEWLEKITLEAAMLGGVPALGITVGDQHWLAFPAWTITPKGGE